jgi:hypothetical protein
MAPTYHDPRRTRLPAPVLPGLAPDPPGKTRDRGLGLGVGPGSNAASPPYAVGERATQRPARRYYPRSHQARRAAIPGVDARRRFGVGAQCPRRGWKGLRRARAVTPCAAHRNPRRGTRPNPQGVLPSGHEWSATLPVSQNAPLSEFDAVAERYPVFRIDPA